MTQLIKEFDLTQDIDIDIEYPKDQEKEFLSLQKEIWIDETYNYLDCRVIPGDIVVDVGANIGMFGKWALKQGAKEVYCIEPEPKNFMFLKQNMPEHSFKFAMSNDTKLTQLYFDSDHTGHSLFKPSKKHKSQKGDTIPVMTTTLKNFFVDQKLTHVDFLKIDAEGAEVDILCDLKELAPQIQKIALEFHIGIVSSQVFTRFITFLEGCYTNVKYTKIPRTNTMVYAWSPKVKVKSEIKQETSKVLIETTLTEDTFSYSFINGPKVQIDGTSDKQYNIKFTDLDDDIVVYETIISPGHWAKASPEYYCNWLLEVFEGNHKIDEHIFNLKNKKVIVNFKSAALGDTLAWLPHLKEFQEKHSCELYATTFRNGLFNKVNYGTTFLEPGIPPIDTYAQYDLGFFLDLNRSKVDPRTISLQNIAAEILGLPLGERQARVNDVSGPRPLKGPYVCIAPHSTAQAKYWNNPTGWQEVVDYLVGKGYLVVNLSKEESTYMGNEPLTSTEDFGYLHLDQIPLILKHAECFIGVSSGLSWLSWAVGQKTILVSGFTEPWYEIKKNCARIHNPNVCTGCFNDSEILFDKGDWNWCPRHKDTDRQFECSKNISSKEVIQAFEDRNLLGFEAPSGRQADLKFLVKEIIEKSEYKHDKCYIEKNDVVVDIGANIGIFSAWAFEQGASTVYSIEPEEKNFSCLKHNAPKAEYFKMAISNKTETKQLYIDGVIGGHSIIRPIENHPTQTGTTAIVKTMTLKDFMDSQMLSKIDFLKVDTEGSEIDILTNIKKLAPQISKIVLEFHHTVHDQTAYEKFLRSLANSYHNIDIKKRSTESIIFAWNPKIKKAKKQSKAALSIGCSAVGDTLAASATLHKLAKICGEPLDVFTFIPELYKNNPDANRVYDIRNEISNEYQPEHFHQTFIDIKNFNFKHNLTDIRQYHASFLGFDLLPEERECIFIPDMKSDFELPEKYVALHPSATWPSRTWHETQWSVLANNLFFNKIPIVLIGKDTSEFLSSSSSTVDKPVFKVEVKDGMDYTNKLSLSDTWHVINGAEAIITMDSSILHLAGTTDTHIIQLGSSINPKLRAPYRNGSQEYKYSYIAGNCNLFCGSNMQYGLKEHNNIGGVPVISECLENKATFECHPTVKNVVNEVKKVYI